MNTIKSINPANNEILGEVIISSHEEIKAKVQLAQQAKKSWKALGLKKRIQLLHPLLAAFVRRKNEIAQLITKEMGKTITESLDGFSFDTEYFEDFFNTAPEYLADEITYQEGKIKDKIVYEPTGVVAAIVPWNYPFSNFYWAVIPNLIAGNPVVFKHSEECLLTAKLFEDIMQKANLPAGVFSAIYGAQETGEILISQDIDMIWFIGSSSVGRKLYEEAGKKQIKAILEMGGSNPAVVFDDVNIDDTISHILSGRFSNCGQSCDAIKRLLVHKNIFKSFVDKLTIAVNNINVGDPLNPEIKMGPLAAMRQLDLLESQVHDAIKKGAQVITGGKRPDGLSGAYYLPTLLTNIQTDMRVWKEEVFGPVLPIIAFDTEEEAITLANNTAYGLGAYIYSHDLSRAERVASAIDAGSITINDGDRWKPCNPFGGFKMSGMGCEHGKLGFQALCRYKLIALG